MIHHFQITVKELPFGWTKGMMKEYLKTAIQQWRKGGDPESEIFDMKDSNFIVK